MSWADIVQDELEPDVGYYSPAPVSMTTTREAKYPNANVEWMSFKAKSVNPNGIDLVNGDLSDHPAASTAPTTSTAVSPSYTEKRIKELEAELAKNEQYTAELVAQVDEKDR